jgi:hypothetical protein
MNNDKVNFFVVGAARSGTTSLYNYLSVCPNVYLPLVKECNYFSRVESLDPEVYKKPVEGKKYHMKIIKKYSDYESLYINARPNDLKGDVSPSYLWDYETAQRIYDYNPHSKIIITLRNPIERAFSHYKMHFNTGYEKNSTFEQAISSKKNMIWGGGNMYLEMGLYYNQVKSYLDIFKKTNVLILIYENWITDINKTMNKIGEFLGTEFYHDFDLYIRHNENKQLKNVHFINFFRQQPFKSRLKKIMPDALINNLKHTLYSESKIKTKINLETFIQLKPYYQGDVKKLEELIVENLSEKWELSDD